MHGAPTGYNSQGVVYTASGASDMRAADVVPSVMNATSVTGATNVTVGPAVPGRLGESMGVMSAPMTGYSETAAALAGPGTGMMGTVAPDFENSTPPAASVASAHTGSGGPRQGFPAPVEL